MKGRRFRLLVNPFQYKLIARIVAYWFIYQVSLWNFLFVWRLYEEGKGNPLDQYIRFFGSYYPMLLCFAILVPFFAWDALRYSHQVSGPLLRFQQTIRAITAGRPVRRIQLRDGDQLLDMQEDFNAMLDALEHRGAIRLADVPPAAEEGPFDDQTIPWCADTPQGLSHDPSQTA